MATTTQNKPRYHGLRVTREEYLDLEEDGFLYDMIDGVLYMSPSAFYEHNRVISRLLTFLENFITKNEIATPAPETDIYLPDGGDVLRPDISVILKENSGIIKGHIHGVPDIVVEVLSKATLERDLGVKADRYLLNGVKEYWIADPDKQTLELWANQDKKEWKKHAGKTLESAVLAGFSVNSHDIFAGLSLE